MFDYVVKKDIGIWLSKNSMRNQTTSGRLYAHQETSMYSGMQPAHHTYNHRFVIPEYIGNVFRCKMHGALDKILHRLECLVRCDRFVTTLRAWCDTTDSLQR